MTTIDEQDINVALAVISKLSGINSVDMTLRMLLNVMSPMDPKDISTRMCREMEFPGITAAMIKAVGEVEIDEMNVRKVNKKWNECTFTFFDGTTMEYVGSTDNPDEPESPIVHEMQVRGHAVLFGYSTETEKSEILEMRPQTLYAYFTVDGDGVWEEIEEDRYVDDE